MKQKINAKREWKILARELAPLPLDSPYPEEIIKRRELLLLAQCLLSDYESTTSKKRKKFLKELYRKVMDLYFSWNTN